MFKKFSSMFLSLCFLLGLLVVTIPAEAAGETKIGYVNSQQILDNYPDIQGKVKAINEAKNDAQKKFDQDSVNMTDAQKQALLVKVNQELQAKQNSIMNPVEQGIKKAIAKVAKARGCTYVVEAGFIHFGGEDLTADVIKELAK